MSDATPTRIYIIYIVVILKVIYGVVEGIKFSDDSKRCRKIILLGTYCGEHSGIIFLIIVLHLII